MNADEDGLERGREKALTQMAQMEDPDDHR